MSSTRVTTVNRSFIPFGVLLIVFLVVFANGLSAAQRMVVPPPPVETFPEATRAIDQPITYREATDNQLVWHTPWGYNREENRLRTYPLVVFGPHKEATLYFTEAIRKRFPAFFFDYGKDGVTAGETLSAFIDARMQVQGYRIDLNRIYLTGWSQGGSGGYNTIQGMLNRGKCFAAFIRIAGQSNSVLPSGAMDKIAISMHIGLEDTGTRVQVSRDLYAYLLNHPSNSDADEAVLNEPAFGRTTKVLSRNGVDIIRYSEYPDMGHTHAEPYSDPAIFEWLMTRAISSNPVSTASLTLSASGNGSTLPSGGTHTVNTGSPTAISATPDAGNVFVNWTSTGGASIANPNAASTTVTVSGNATVTANFSETGGSTNDWTILSPSAAGSAVSGSYFPLDHAFDAQPSWDSNAGAPVGGVAGEHAPAYANRYGYVDFGPDYNNLRIVETWTRYRTYSSGDQGAYAELWWDNNPGIDKVDAVAEPRFNFNSAQGLQNTGENEIWVRDSNTSSFPITPPRRFLILRSPDSVTGRAKEYAFVGYIEATGNTPPTLISPGNQTVQVGQTIIIQLEEAYDPDDDDTLSLSASGNQP
ncbi:MAG: hypothetical protein JW706_10645 [Opitutales bacterium]|nr:hypothetical protein [Opitutales bacterium]